MTIEPAALQRITQVISACDAANSDAAKLALRTLRTIEAVLAGTADERQRQQVAQAFNTIEAALVVFFVENAQAARPTEEACPL